jgi:putative oxidoreductase
MPNLWTRLTQTKNDPTLTVARWVLAIIFFGHGAQKAFGWFGGMGFERAVALFQDTMSIPPALTVLIMLVAPFANHLYPRFFMNWSGTREGEGYEYHLLAIALLLILIVRGSGALSLDRFISASSVKATKVA